jgi:hypothetical protein
MYNNYSELTFHIKVGRHTYIFDNVSNLDEFISKNIDKLSNNFIIFKNRKKQEVGRLQINKYKNNG